MVLAEQRCPGDWIREIEGRKRLSRMTRHYAVLDGLRGVAALAVVVFHSHHMLGYQPVPSSYLAVDFFFGLSGFVIAHAYLKRLANGMSLRDFIAVRTIRLYPLYLVASLLALGLLVFRILAGKAEFDDLAISLPNILLVPWPGSTDLFALNFIAWSLLVEMVVNVLFAIWAIRSPRLRGLSLVIVLAAVALAATSAFFQGLDPGVRWSDAWGGLVRAAFSFTVGVGLCLVMRDRRADLPPFVVVPLLIGLTLTFLPSLSGTQRGLYDLVVVALVYPVFIAVGASVRPPGPRFGMSSGLLWLGSISYAIYVLHVPVSRLANRAFEMANLQPSTVRLAMFMIAISIVGTIADRWFDVPVRSWLSQRFYRWAARR